MQQGSSTRKSKRDTGWKRVKRGVYRRGQEWGFYSTQLGRVQGGFGSQDEAEIAKANDKIRKKKGAPAPNTRSKLDDYFDLVEQRKDWKPLDLYALKLAREHLGHLKPAQCGPDRLERYEADLASGKITGNPLGRESVDRYMCVLPPVFRLAVRDGAIPVSPLSLIEREKRPAKKPQHRWSREDIANLIDAAERLAREPKARYDYSPIIRTQIATGMRPSEVLALRVEDVDLLGGRIFVRHSLQRTGPQLGPTKTEAGVRVVPLSDELVKFYVKLIPEDAAPDDFVFHALGNPKRAISYTNYRDRGFTPAVKAAGLDGKGITPHKLRRAFVSAAQWAGVTLVEVSGIVGHADPSVTAKAYSDIFEPEDAHRRVREAQSKVLGDIS
jgi:integrase